MLKIQNAENTQNVSPCPSDLFIVSNVDVTKNAKAQLNAPAADPATLLISFAYNSPIIIHGIGPVNMKKACDKNQIRLISAANKETYQNQAKRE